MRNNILILIYSLINSLSSSLTKVRLKLKLIPVLKKIIIPLFFLFAYFSVAAQFIEDHQTFGGTATDKISGITIDELNTTYLTGTFDNTLIIKDTLLTNGDDDVFIAQLDFDGTPLWAKNFGSISDEKTSDIIYQNGFLYTTGFFWDTIQVDGQMLVSGADGSGIYIIKMDTLGNIIWTDQLIGNGIKTVENITIDPSENIYITGRFSQNIHFRTTNIPVAGNMNMYILKVNPTTSAYQLNTLGQTQNTRGKNILHNQNNHIYALGQFNGQVQIDGTTINSGANDENGFLVKMTDQIAPLSSVWIKEFAGVGDAFPIDLTLDDHDNIYVAGYFINSLSVGNQTIQTASNDKDIFIAKFNSTGQLLQLKGFGTNSDEFINSIYYQNGQLLLGGYYIGNTQFGTIPLVGDPFSPVGFICQTDTFLNVNFAEAKGDLATDAFVNEVIYNHKSISNQNDFMMAAGDFLGNFAADPNIFLPSNGSFDFFISKKRIVIAAQKQVLSKLELQVFPNPVQDYLTIKIATNQYQIMIYNTLGQKVHDQNTWINEQITLPVSALENGLYYLKISSKSGQITMPFVLQR